MQWDDGVRRSTRIRSKPLDWWKGERFLRGRIHKSMHFPLTAASLFFVHSFSVITTHKIHDIVIKHQRLFFINVVPGISARSFNRCSFPPTTLAFHGLCRDINQFYNYICFTKLPSVSLFKTFD
jgi:hypothetical protein